MTRLARQQGFTLVEVLVALMLMAILSLISWRALDSVVSTSERLEAAADDLTAIVRVLGQLEQDIQRHAGRDVLPERPAPAPEGGQPAQTSTGAGAVLPPGIQVPESDRNAATLLLVRATPDRDGNWQQVVWRQAAGTLRRAVGAPAHALPLPMPDPDGDIVLSGLQQFFVRAWLPGQGWTPLPAPDGSAAATGLEITIQRERGGQSETFRKVVLLP